MFHWVNNNGMAWATASPQVVLEAESPPSPMHIGHEESDMVESSCKGQPSNVDKLAATEMLALSMSDREKVYFDIHGVSEEVTETNELIQKSLLQFERLLRKSNNSSQQQALRLASHQDPLYVQNPEFRLCFLRADRFDVPAAVNRFLSHFQLKLELFGEQMLTKEITQDDLDDDDLDALYNTISFTLPSRDPAGRLVLVRTSHNANPPIRAMMRKTFYALMAGTHDEEIQRKGCVVVSYLVGQPMVWEEFTKRQKMNHEWGRALAAIPLRLEALHVCFDSFVWRSLVAVFKLTANMFTRLRVREHYGDPTSVLFSLQTFGILLEGLSDELVAGSTRSNQEFWEQRREWERQQRRTCNRSLEIVDTKRIGSCSPTLALIAIPGQFDVLLGRGKSAYNHFGNIRLRHLVAQRVEQYDESQFTKKRKVAEEIVEVIQQSKGRFIRPEGAGWVEVSDDVSRRKVCNAFRTLRALSVSTIQHPEQQDGVAKRSREE
eukprot:Nitzschia sp. Nitz4//scaffold83_size84149//82297//83772//NITZ4_005190-RA/size84149-processed-gene-0.82-mRNA-1//1//CDS//3329558995//6181//frame0